MADQSGLGLSPESDLHIEFLNPEGPPVGVVVVVHGYAEHSGRYGVLADRFLESGFSVVLYDQRGFGRSPGRPAYVERIGRLVEDLGHVVAAARLQWRQSPLFLFAHSMGGLVATLYCQAVAAQRAEDRPERPGPVDGLILSSPLLKTQEAALLQRIATVLGTVAPRLPTIPMDRSAISRDPQVVAEANEDPLNYHGRIPARTGAEFVRGMRRVWRDAHQLRLPIMLIHGTADRLTDPDGSRELYTAVSSNYKQLSLFEGSYHETFNDTERDRVIEGIVDWLEEAVSE